jgi:DNA-binding beta-propeller fold protein YncE
MTKPVFANERTSPLLGSGDWTYRMHSDWARLPAGWTFGDVAGVAVDGDDNVLAFHRGDHPLIVFDRQGNFLRSWGEGLFSKPHGIAFGADGCVYCTDEGDHTIRKFSTEGKLLLEIGVPNRPAAPFSGKPFNRCTHTALSPRGDIYVADGYQNARVHKFDPDGRLIASWGSPGSGAGQFQLVHNITTDPDGWVYVADRENHRVQVFDGDGRYETEWKNLHRPCGLCTQVRSEPVSFIGELGSPGMGPRVSIVDHRGAALASLDAGAASGPEGRFIAPHGVAVDSRDDLYIAEVGLVGWRQRHPDAPVPAGLSNLKKLVRHPAVAITPSEST